MNYALMLSSGSGAPDVWDFRRGNPSRPIGPYADNPNALSHDQTIAACHEGYAVAKRDHSVVVNLQNVILDISVAGKGLAIRPLGNDCEVVSTRYPRHGSPPSDSSQRSKFGIVLINLKVSLNIYHHIRL
jgi:hypothetical protein